MASVGADPEFFVKSNATGDPVPAGVFLKATKDRPHKLGGSGYAVQQDNVMVEYNIPAATSWKELNACLSNGLKLALEHCSSQYEKRAKTSLSVVAKPELFWSMKDLNTAKGAREFGCSPEFDAYGEPETPIVADREGWANEKGEWRTAGGHLHFGVKSPAPPYIAALFADMAFGVFLTMDPATLRAKSYGLPGRFRPTSYGFEYRPLSNFYLFDRDMRAEICQRAFALGNFLERDEEQLRRAYMATPWADLRKAIVARSRGQVDRIYAETRNVYGW